MTVEEAVKILNENRHQGHNDWFIVYGTEPLIVVYPQAFNFLYKSGAITIAKRYIEPPEGPTIEDLTEYDQYLG